MHEMDLHRKLERQCKFSVIFWNVSVRKQLCKKYYAKEDFEKPVYGCGFHNTL